MADISKVTLLNGDTYNLKDEYARQEIENLGPGIEVLFDQTALVFNNVPEPLPDAEEASF